MTNTHTQIHATHTLIFDNFAYSKITHCTVMYVFLYRPVTTASGRHVRLGTASMLTEPGGPFIDVSKLNLAKYASRPALAKVRERVNE